MSSSSSLSVKTDNSEKKLLKNIIKCQFDNIAKKPSDNDLENFLKEHCLDLDGITTIYHQSLRPIFLIKFDNTDDCENFLKSYQKSEFKYANGDVVSVQFYRVS